MSDWTGWGVIEGEKLVYLKQDHEWPEVSEFDARQELQIRSSRGENARLARVYISEQNLDLAVARDRAARLQRGLEQAREWLQGWASAEPYLARIDAMLAESSDQLPAEPHASRR